MATGDVWVATAKLYVRCGPGPSYNATSWIPEGTVITEISREDVGNGEYVQIYYNNITGYICAEYLKGYDGTTSEVNTYTGEDLWSSEVATSDGLLMSVDYDNIMQNATFSNIDDSVFSKMKNVAGVFGLPYQFLPLTDPRLTVSNNDELSSSSIGYEYAEKIIQRMPMLLISPGKPEFMKGFSTKTKRSIVEELVTKGGGNSESILDSLDNQKGRYYTFEYKTREYYKYVNPMCRLAARYLGLQNTKINGEYIDEIDWMEFTKSGISGIGNWGDFSAIPFYLDTDTSVNEDFGNSTAQSMIASSVNSISDYARELNFLLGYTSTALNSDMLRTLDTNFDRALADVEETIDRVMGKGNMLSNLASHLNSIVSGGRLLFPEIWSDSSFSKSYSCSFKFISPDPSNLSIFLNVLVPVFHLMGLVAPHTVDGNPNIYDTPFIVRAIYKGFFNVDMGIISDMSITRGAECQWTPDGIPTSVEVRMTIKDLYPAMSITPTTSNLLAYDTMNNMALMDYIANLCGINMYKPEPARMIDMWFTNNIKNRVEDIPANIWGNITDKVQTIIMNFYRGYKN